jgi:hypothetical protein
MHTVAEVLPNGWHCWAELLIIHAVYSCKQLACKDASNGIEHFVAASTARAAEALHVSTLGYCLYNEIPSVSPACQLPCSPSGFPSSVLQSVDRPTSDSRRTEPPCRCSSQHTHIQCSSIKLSNGSRTVLACMQACGISAGVGFRFSSVPTAAQEGKARQLK